MLALVVVLCLAACACASDSIATEVPQLRTVQSLETSLLGRFSQCSWTRTTQTTQEQQPPQELASMLSLQNKTGLADSHFTYERNTSDSAGFRFVNLLIVRLYDSPYVNAFYAELRLPLQHYGEKERRWSGSSVAVATFYNHWARLGSFNLTVAFEVEERRALLRFSNGEVLALTEDATTEVRYFPVFYIPLMCIAAVMMELCDGTPLRRLSPLMIVVMTIKLLCRSVLFLTQSFTAPTPYGALMVLSAVVNTFLLVRFVHRHHRFFGLHKHNRSATLVVMVLMCAEVLLAFNPYYNCLAVMLPVLQLLVNASTRRNADPQHGFLACFVMHSLLPLYYSLDSSNVFRIEPVRWAGWLMLALLALQILLLKLQEFQTRIRCYFRRRKQANLNSEFAGSDCPICLAPIGNQPLLVTDCKHVFHEDCLRSWAEIRNVCPLDRQSISKELLDEV